MSRIFMWAVIAALVVLGAGWIILWERTISYHPCNFGSFTFGGERTLQKEKETEKVKKIVYGRGYVRGSSQYTLKNKYGAFVKKVNIYSHRMAKKGDVILEYDDFDIRTKIVQKENQISQQKKEIRSLSVKLAKTRLDPLPSDYRNVSFKRMAAQERYKRLRHELGVYRKLASKNIVSDLSLREKLQDVKDAQADVESYARDSRIIASGLANFNISLAENDLELARVKLANLKKELALLQEEKSYYKLRVNRDGYVITHSDTVGAWNAAATSAAEIHICKNGRKLIYCYFDERDIIHVREGVKYPFRSSQYDIKKHGYAYATCYEIKKSHSSYGDRSLYLVKCRLEESPVELKINSTGSLEVEVPH